MLFLLTSCNTTKFLEVEQFLLVNNDIELMDGKHIENKRSMKYELSTLYRQQENTSFFFIPREWIYFKAQDPEDTTKWDRWKLRVLAETPAIFDPMLADATLEDMKNYLKFQGYYDVSGFYDDEVRGDKKIRVTYYLNPGPRYTIDSVFFSSPDPRIDKELQQIKNTTVLQRGAGLTGQLYELEKDRITRYLRNNGYAYFYPNYFPTLEADTTLKPQQANLYVKVLPPFDDSLHQVYYVGDVTVYPDFDPTLPESARRDSVIQECHFRYAGNEFEVKPQTILDAIHLRPGERFSQENFDKTNQQLSAFGIYKFVRIKQLKDSLTTNKLNFRIELTSNKKMELGIDFELSYTNRSTANAPNLLGLSASPSLSNRNAFHGAELLVSSLSAGMEVNPNVNNSPRFFNTADIRFQSDLYFPKFMDYLNIWRGLNRTRLSKNKKLLSDRFYTLLDEKAATRFSASYNFLLLLDFYQINSFNASYGFDVQRSNTNRYIFNHIGIDLLFPVSFEKFDEIKKQNPFLDRSFGSQLFVSLLFRDFTYVFNSRPNRFGESHFLRANVELAGAEVWAGNAIYNAFALNPDTLHIGDGDKRLDFSQYLKFELDGRYYKQYSTKRSLAARANIGVARPFGYTTDVPYVKQFFVGGPSSIRAWPARGLGPGGYEDPLNLDPENRLILYQTGDLKLELNLEYRFEIFWRLKGALFLDAGNVWTLRQDDGRPGSQLLFREKTYLDENGATITNDPFYKQLAVGGGLGFRFDFTYFIFRVDLGYPLRYPYPFRTTRDGSNASIREADYWTDFSGLQLKDLNLNLGLGYPF